MLKEFFKRLFNKGKNGGSEKVSPQIVLKIDDFKSYIEAARNVEDSSSIEKLKEERKKMLIEAISEGVKVAVIESIEKAIKLYSENTSKVVKETVREEVNKAIDRNIDRIARRTVDLGTETIVKYVREAYGDGLENKNREHDNSESSDVQDVSALSVCEYEDLLPESCENLDVVDAKIEPGVREVMDSTSVDDTELELSSTDNSIGIYDTPSLHNWRAIYALNAYPFKVLRQFLKTRSSGFLSGDINFRRKMDKFVASFVGNYVDNLYGSFSVACSEKFDVSEDTLSKGDFISLEKDLYSDVIASLNFFHFTFLEKGFNSDEEPVGDLEHFFTSVRDTCGVQLSDDEIYEEFFAVLMVFYTFAVREYLTKRFNTYSISINRKSVLYKSRYDIYKRISLYSHLFSSFFVSLTGLVAYRRMNPEFAFLYSVFALFHDFGKAFSVKDHDSRAHYDSLKNRVIQFFEDNRDSFQSVYGSNFDFSSLYSKYEDYFRRFFVISIEAHHFKNREDLFYDLDISKDSSLGKFISVSMENVFTADKLSRILELRVFGFLDSYSGDLEDLSSFYQDLFTYIYKEKGKGGESFYNLIESRDLKGYRIPKFFKDVFDYSTIGDVISSFVMDLKSIILDIQADPRAFLSDGVSYSESLGVIEIPLEIFYSYLYSEGWFHSFGYYKDKKREVERSYEISLFILSRFLEKNVDLPVLKNMFILMNLPVKHSEAKRVVKIKTDILRYLQ